MLTLFPKHPWRIPLIVVALAALALLLIAWAESREFFSMPANAFLAAFSTVGATLITLFIWFVRGAPVSRTIRRRVAFAGLAALVLAIVFVRLEGVSGDIHFRFGWRFAPRADERLPKAASNVAAESTANLRDTTQFDFPQFLGKERLATVDNVRLDSDWARHPPKQLWKQPIGAGWSGFVVVGDFAVTQEQRGEEELVTCYEVPSGKLVWAHATPVRYSGAIAGIGPRATPTIHAGRVYALGATGFLICLDGATGEPIWQHDIVQENKAQLLIYGMSGSPLIHNNLVIVSSGAPNGKSLLAYDAESGKLVWSGGSSQTLYSSPMLATLAGREQILIINVNEVSAHDPTDGRVLWTHPFVGYDPSSPSCSQPIVIGDDRLLLSKGYGIGSELIQIESDGEKLRARQLWKKNILKTKFTNAVIRDGFAYGLDEGVLECIDVAGGTKKWKQGKFGHGQLLLVDDLLLVQSENGDVALVEADGRGYHELTRMPAITGTCWNTPALSGNRLLIRSNEEAACFELPLTDAIAPAEE